MAYELLTEEELEKVKMDSVTSSYLKQIGKYPLLSNEEFLRYFNEYKNGDLKAKEMLINCNLRLVVFVAKKHVLRTKSMALLDLVQEGTIGLIKALESYDPEKGAFSTIAVEYINGFIKRSIYNTDEQIRRAPQFIMDRIKYKKLIGEYYSIHNKYPDDEYIKDTLKISDETLKLLKEEKNLEVTSYNKTVDEGDSESDELEAFIGEKDESYEKLEEANETFDFLNVIQSLLSRKEYYVLYERILNKTTLKEIATTLNISGERVRTTEARAIEKIKPFVIKESKEYKKVLNDTIEKHGNMYYKLKIKPLTPNDICLFLYLQTKLNSIDQQILYYKLIDVYNYEYSDLKDILKISKEEFDRINRKLDIMLKLKLNEKEKFNKFKSDILKENGTDIYNLNLFEKEYIDYRTLNKRYSKMTMDDFEYFFKKIYLEMPEQQRNLLYRYFAIPPAQRFSRSVVNKEITLVINGLKESRDLVEKGDLYKTYIKNKEIFSEEQILFIESYIFGIKPKKEYNELYGDKNISNAKDYLLYKLQLIHFGLDNLYQNKFNVKSYLKVRNKYADKIGEKRLYLLDLYCGVNNKSLKTIGELAEEYNVSYRVMHDWLRDAREFVMNLYANRNSTVDINKSMYHKYILDPRFQMIPESRKILKLFMIENKTYDEISDITGLTNYKISNIVTEMIRKMDNYRFGLMPFEDYSKEDLEMFFESTSSDFTKEEKEIIKIRFLKGKENKDIAKEKNITLEEVNRLIGRFNKFYFLYQIKDVNVDIEEIKNEVNLPLIESVLDEREKKYLSYYYGFKNNYNLTGEKLEKVQIQEKFNITSGSLNPVLIRGRNKVKARKINILKPELLYIEKEELIKYLKDPHLPISRKERDIIYSLFGLNGYKKSNLEQLGYFYNEKEQSIKRRYMRAIISILKYENNEIEGSINYEEDILPNLKYFPNNYRLLIEEYYKNGMTYDQISKKYKLTWDQVTTIFDRIKIDLYEMIKNSNKNKFDFEFYEKNRFNPDLPFYKNLELADQIFRLYYGMDGINRVSIPEIIKRLNLDYNDSTIIKHINCYMMSFCALKKGVTKKNVLSYEDIKDCYLKYENEIPNNMKKEYQKYFERILNDTSDIVFDRHINESLLYDVISRTSTKNFEVLDTTKAEVFDILKKHYKKILPSTKEVLMGMFFIRERNFMNGKEINHVYRILHELEKKLLKEVEKNQDVLIIKKMR